MDRLMVTCLAAAMSAPQIFAGTVGWWRFEEGGYATATTGTAGEIVNSVSSDYGSGRAVTVSVGNVLGKEAELMPRYDLPASLYAGRKGKVYDPVSGNSWTSSSSLRMPVSGATSAERAGGAVIIDNDTRFTLADYTVECFVRLPRHYQALNVYGPIVGKVKGTQFHTESWALLFLSSGKLAFRYNGTGTPYTSPPGSAVINDGEWHHLALVCDYDEEEKESTWTIYCDGKADFSYTKSGQTEYTNVGTVDKDDGGIFVGGYRYEGRKSDLRIDELRISDKALKPEEFLRLIPGDDLPQFVTDDTLVWMPFDLPAGIPSASELFGRNFNAVTNVNAVLTRANSGCASEISSAVPAGSLREGFTKMPAYVNESSMRFCRDDANINNAYYIEGRSDWFAGDFTVETFFKTAKNGYTSSHTILDFTDIKLFLYSGNPHYLTLSYRPDGKDQVVAKFGSPVCDDGKWHHLAAVYSKENKTLRVYVDHKLGKEVADVTLNAGIRNARVGIYLSGGADLQVFDGYIDSLRVSREALDPVRFLNGRVNVEEDSTLFRASFNGDLEAYSSSEYFTFGDAGRYSSALSEDPAYSSETNWGFRVYQDGETMKNPLNNPSVLKLKGSYVNFSRQNQLTTGEHTCEFFCKLKSLDAMCGLVRINRSGTSTTGAPVWALYSEKSSAEADGKMILRITGLQNGSNVDAYLALPSAGEIFDNRWHHVALTFAETADNKIKVTMYKDYEVLTSAAFDGRLAGNSSSQYLVSVGMSGDMSKTGLDGYIDELRISRGVLPVSRFMRAERLPRGLRVIVR